MRTFGDPVLRSRASEVTEFDDQLAAEAERMVAIMRDAMGVGLAATQLGVLRRLLVFQAGADATPTAVANPELEWVSDELAVAEEGCLSLPGIGVDVERPLHARVRGRDVHGEPLMVEASGLEARVLQHEIDHLDGVLILDRTEREQRKGALRALREGEQLLARGRRARVRRREPDAGCATVFLGTSDFAAAVLERLAAGEHRPALVVTPAGPAPRPRAPARLAARRRGRSRARDRAAADRGASESPPALERIRAAAPEVGVVCAFGQLIREPLLSELELLNVHPSLLPRWRGAAPIERAIMAGDGETGRDDHARHRGARLGPDRAPGGGSRSPPTTTTARSRPRLAELGGELIVEALDLRAAGELELADQDDSAATYAEKIEPAERRLDPARPATELERDRCGR